jgi:hypothetical protein
MKKPMPRKRKGYASGGFVDDTGDQLANTLNAIPNRTPEQSQRYIAARNAMASADVNESGRTTSAEGKGRWQSGRAVELGRADYPGFRKGGKVKRIVKAKRK